ncbi:MAG: T9SS type A sorting domain-containing protein, partial [Chitinophagales bacterium]
KEIVTSKTSIITDLYPNPASDFISVAVTNTGKYRIEIFDINGVLITTKQFRNSDMKIATNTFASGVYVLRIYNEENSTIDTKKFVVKH